MKKYLFIIFIILFFSSNFFAYSIENIDTKIIIKENGVLEITDVIFFKNVNNNEEIILPIIPVYDLKIKTDNKGITYSYSLDYLTINLNNCCLLDNSITINIVYLTDFYTLKKGSIWTIDYYPIFREYVDTFSIYFLKNTEIINFSDDYKNIHIKDNKFLYTSDNFISNFRVDYSININNIEENKNFNKFILYFFILILLIIMVYFFIRNIFVSKKKDNSLLLGLNENEQKIINIIIKENGILQKKISKECFLPKGTVSRNLKKLESKGYIEIKRYGVNKKVFLGPVFSKK